MKGGYIYADVLDPVALRSAITRVGLPVLEKTSHVTIVYAPAETMKVRREFDYQKFLNTGPINTTAQKVDLWTDHKGEKILVLRLLSPDLMSRHIFWRTKGLVHTYPVYSPHITLTESLSKDNMKHLDFIIQMLESDLVGSSIKLGGENYTLPKPIKVESRSKLPSIPKLTLSLPGIPVYKPDLDEDEEANMRKHGFNVDSRKRVKALVKDKNEK